MREERHGTKLRNRQGQTVRLSVSHVSLQRSSLLQPATQQHTRALALIASVCLNACMKSIFLPFLLPALPSDALRYHLPGSWPRTRHPSLGWASQAWSKMQRTHTFQLQILLALLTDMGCWKGADSPPALTPWHSHGLSQPNPPKDPARKDWLLTPHGILNITEPYIPSAPN